MTTLSFTSVDDVDEKFLSTVFPSKGSTINSIFRLRDATKRILNDPKEILTVEYESGKSLNSLATEYLGKSFLWETIATLNDIDPTKPINIGDVIKIPSEKQIKNTANKLIAPEANRIIDSVKGSILEVTGLNKADTKFGQNLRDCVDKVIDFKISF